MAALQPVDCGKRCSSVSSRLVAVAIVSVERPALLLGARQLAPERRILGAKAMIVGEQRGDLVFEAGEYRE